MWCDLTEDNKVRLGVRTPLTSPLGLNEGLIKMSDKNKNMGYIAELDLDLEEVYGTKFEKEHEKAIEVDGIKPRYMVSLKHTDDFRPKPEYAKKVEGRDIEKGRIQVNQYLGEEFKVVYDKKRPDDYSIKDIKDRKDIICDKLMDELIVEML